VPVPIKRRLYASRLYALAKRLKDAFLSITPGQNRWRRSTLALYGQFLAPGDLAFDIGANVGVRTDLFLRLGVRVVAVEPQAVCVARLNQKYRGDARVVVVSKALGRMAGMAQMMVSQAHTISSISRPWVDAVTSSGRFADYEWGHRQDVTVITLDELIATFGQPAFCKIDVEGSEADVLAGLSSSIPALSFEFIPEMAEAALACIDRLLELGNFEFNYDLSESMHLQLASWVGREEIKARLEALKGDEFGDIYARIAAS
jgi:FkbM family methyltransferase